jgi:hypothetical protein
MLPETIRTEEELLDVMTRPKPVLVEFMQTLSSPLVILGAWLVALPMLPI